MDGTAAIQSNLEALKRILAGLVAMAGLGCLSSPLAGEDGSARRGDVSAETQRAKADESTEAWKAKVEAEPLAEPCEGSGSSPTLPRHLRLAILRLLRPAESAARRLIIASARGLVVTLPPPRKPRPKPATMEPQLRRFGIAVVVSPAALARDASILPRLRGRGTAGGGGGGGRPRTLTLALFDPPRRVRANGYRRRVPAHTAPRILFPGSTVGPHPEVRAGGEPRRTPDDPVDATRLGLRLAALAAALDDLPGQAKRFARWKAARAAAGAQRKDRADAAGAQKENRDIWKGSAPRRIMRISPLRSGRPPGGRLSRFDPSASHPRNIREVDEILAHAHALALYALQHPDTS